MTAVVYNIRGDFSSFHSDSPPHGEATSPKPDDKQYQAQNSPLSCENYTSPFSTINETGEYSTQYSSTHIRNEPEKDPR